MIRRSLPCLAVLPAVKVRFPWGVISYFLFPIHSLLLHLQASSVARVLLPLVSFCTIVEFIERVSIDDRTYLSSSRSLRAILGRLKLMP
jgi:hypothetical protein